MEEKKTIFDYISQVFLLFGIMMVLMNVFCMIFGESAKDVSTMFALGDKGLSTEIMMQYFGIAVLTTFFRFVFFTDVLIKKWSLLARVVGMEVATISIVIVAIIMFKWFPVDMLAAWGMFLLCFVICLGVSLWITAWNKKVENAKMEEALQRLKRENK